jgi:hypothetical protein
MSRPERRTSPLDPVFHGDRRRHAVPERRRVGEDLGGAVGAELGREGEVVGVEVEERLDAAGGEPAELDEGAVERGADAGLRVLHGIAVAADRAARGDVGAGGAGDLVAEEGAERAVLGPGAGVHVQAAAGQEADGVLAAVERFGEQVLGADTAADAEAGVGAGMKKKPAP